jgi:hypothetical protein
MRYKWHVARINTIIHASARLKGRNHFADPNVDERIVNEKVVRR